MATAEAVQSLQDEFRKVMDQAKTTQTSLQDEFRKVMDQAKTTQTSLQDEFRKVMDQAKTTQTSLQDEFRKVMDQAKTTQTSLQDEFRKVMDQAKTTQTSLQDEFRKVMDQAKTTQTSLQDEFRKVMDQAKTTQTSLQDEFRKVMDQAKTTQTSLQDEFRKVMDQAKTTQTSLQDEFRKVMDQAKTTQTSLQQLRSAKKEADVTKRRQEVLKSLKTVQTSMEQLQHDMQESEVGLEEALGLREEQSQHEDTPQQKQEEKKGIPPIGIVKTRKLTPQQQETLYELKASRMGAMQSQNQALKRELLLTQRKKHMLGARYAMTQSFSGSETLRAAHALEAKLRGANLKIKGLEDELRKSQQMALRYRELYEDSQRQNEAENASRDRQRRSKSAPKHNDVMRAITPKPAPLKEQSFIGPNTNVNDVVRKNECLLEENDVQKREIQRLKRDNAELILIAKTSSTDRDTVLARLGTSETARQDVLKRYHKLKNEYSRVSRSFTRQAAEWIDSKKQHQHYGTQGRWDELRPVEPHGSRERFFEHSQQNQDSLPRQMYPVESYGGASKA